jgi:hypothetical protein
VQDDALSEQHRNRLAGVGGKVDDVVKQHFPSV